MAYYKILNIDPSSSMDQIIKSYEEISSKINDEEYMRDVEKAYQTLSNYHSRRIYDNQSENNIIQNVTASNEDGGNEFFLNDKMKCSTIMNNFSNNCSFNELNKSEDIESLFINLNKRLEQIEKKIDTERKTNFYREKKFIKEEIKNSKKIITIENSINDNGFKTKSSKVIEYDENGNKKIYFPKKSNGKKQEDI